MVIENAAEYARAHFAARRASERKERWEHGAFELFTGALLASFVYAHIAVAVDGTLDTHGGIVVCGSVAIVGMFAYFIALGVATVAIDLYVSHLWRKVRRLEAGE